MSPLVQWSRLVRYVSEDGQVKYGEPQLKSEEDDVNQLAHEGKLVVTVLEGSTPLTAKPTTKTETVAKLLGPLTPSDVSYIRCIGLNYKTHSEQHEVFPASCILSCDT